MAIDLTVIELSEQVEARYVKGEYVRLDQDSAVKRSRYVNDHRWTTTKDYSSGRLCLQSFSPEWRDDWTKHRRETKGHDLTSRIGSIVKELVEAAPVVAALIEEGERKAELERKQWEAERRDERKQTKERSAKARKDSRDELDQIVKTWAYAKRLEAFFSDAEARLEGLDPDPMEQMRDRPERCP